MDENLTKEEIKALYNELHDTNCTPQKRGYEFEKLIKAKLKNESLEPRASYRPKGEQIDGSFFWEGQTFLLEAKWVKGKIPAADIYSFKGKLDGKFHTTSGIFFAINGYSQESEDALKTGKSLNILLFDKGDIDIIFNGDISFLDVLKFKLREAGDTGSLNVPYKLIRKVKAISKNKGDILIFVEGKSDVILIEKFIKLIDTKDTFYYKIVELEGVNNIKNLPALLNLHADFHQTKAALVFLDDDQLTLSNQIRINEIKRQIQTSPNAVKTEFYFIDDYLKKLINSNSKKDVDLLKKQDLYSRTESHINYILSDYYQSSIKNPDEIIENIIYSGDWDFDKKVIVFPDIEMDVEIKSLEDLVEYLDKETINAMLEDMPLNVMKELTPLDYDAEVREFLYYNHQNNLKFVEWDISEL